MAGAMTMIARLQDEVANLTKLLDCCEERERRYKEMRELVKDLGRAHDVHYCWCQVKIGNPMMRGEHSLLCKQLFQAVIWNGR